jgi:hypothetical protein
VQGHEFKPQYCQKKKKNVFQDLMSSLTNGKDPLMSTTGEEEHSQGVPKVTVAVQQMP